MTIRTLGKKVDIELTQHNALSWDLYFKTNTDGVLTARDITGWTIFLTVKRRLDDSDSQAMVSKTITSHTDAVNGVSIISILLADTDFDAGVYYYDIKYLDTAGNQVTFIYGNYIIKKASTNRTV